MNNLSKHISYLLHRHDCVIVPGIGAFIVSEKGACFDKEANKIYPPCRSISFNRAVNADDGLLAHSYTRKNKALFEEGRMLMARDIEVMKRVLDSAGECRIWNVGTLKVDSENKMIFTPCKNDGAVSELYPEICLDGMLKKSRNQSMSVDSGRSTLSIHDSRVCPVENGNSAPEESLEVNMNSERDFFRDSDRYYHFSINKTLARVVACIAVVLIMTIAVLLTDSGKPSVEDRASVVPMESMIPVVKKTIRIAGPSEAESVEKQTSDKMSETGFTTEKDSTSHRYYLIVATFKTKTEAERYVRESGKTSGKLNVITSGKISRVYAASSDNVGEMYSTLNSDKFRSEYKEGWIWSMK